MHPDVWCPVDDKSTRHVFSEDHSARRSADSGRASRSIRFLPPRPCPRQLLQARLDNQAVPSKNAMISAAPANDSCDSHATILCIAIDTTRRSTARALPSCRRSASPAAGVSAGCVTELRSCRSLYTRNHTVCTGVSFSCVIIIFSSLASAVDVCTRHVVHPCRGDLKLHESLCEVVFMRLGSDVAPRVAVRARPCVQHLHGNDSESA